MNPISLALIVLGVAGICYGCWLVVPAAGFVVGGILMLLGGVALLSTSDQNGGDR